MAATAFDTIVVLALQGSGFRRLEAIIGGLLATVVVCLMVELAVVHPSLAEHWAQTVQFLDIVTKFWPAYLAERGLVSPAERQNRLLRAEAERLRASPPAGPVIVAGATGSIPATAELMDHLAARKCKATADGRKR